jgi:hypothetical protein
MCASFISKKDKTGEWFSEVGRLCKMETGKKFPQLQMA